ncbi:MAG TPA: hypothetical protein VGL81_22365 [Polyangiaceae bacterium]
MIDVVALRGRARDVARAAWRSRALRGAVVILAIYLLMDLVMSCEMSERGLLSPDGSIHVDAIVLGAACLVTRVTVRFVLPALVAIAVVRLGIDAASRRVR